MHTDDESPMTHWPQTVIDMMLADIAAGASVERACSRPGAPSRATLFRWIGSNADLAERYADAVRAQVHARYVKE
ncbi:terminase small subunit-like protein [Paraburkholderia sediminicola]|uniref:terminase small subunit-like protein n=1 Tax=Paraburkholderia sediminicola TaxID=458836 RepID=UPI0038BD4FB2